MVFLIVAHIFNILVMPHNCGKPHSAAEVTKEYARPAVGYTCGLSAKCRLAVNVDGAAAPLMPMRLIRFMIGEAHPSYHA
jgi:hypothetical protein